MNERVVQGESGECKTREWCKVSAEDKRVVQGGSWEWEMREWWKA